MDAVRQADFARLCDVSRPSVSIAIKAGRLVLRSDGLISISDPINAKYLADKRAKKKADKLQGSLLPDQPAQAAPPRADSAPGVFSGTIPLADDDDLGDQGDSAGGSDPVPRSLAEREKLASIRWKEAQTARHIQGLAEQMGELIDRKEVIRHDLLLGAELKVTFLGMPKSLGPRMYTLVKDGASESEFVRYFEDAMVGGLKQVVAVLEQPYE